MLGLVQADVRPVLPAVDGLVHAVADGNAVAHPGFASTDPNDLGVAGIDRDRADRLHRLLVEDRFVGRAAVNRFPHAAARLADVQR